MATAKGARNAAIWGSQTLLDNQPKVLGELQQGYDTSQAQLGKAGDLYAGMAGQGAGAVKRLQDLTLGDPASIQASLEATPGYSFAFDQGNQALARARAAQGMLASGNTDIDAMKFGQGLASQTLTQERQAQLPLIDLYKTGVGGQANVLGQQALGTTGYFGDRASVLDNTTKSIVGLGTEAFKAGDAAKNANQANALNIGMGIGKLALGGLTGGLGGGFTGLFGGSGIASNALGAATGFNPFASNM